MSASADRTMLRIARGGVATLFFCLFLNSCRPEELFRTGFEEPAALTAHYVEYGQQWRNLSGIPALPGEDKGFQPLIAPESNADTYVQEHIVTVPGRDGQLTQALFQLVLADDPAQDDNSRSVWFFTPDERMREGYQSSWIYFQPNLLDVMSADWKDGRASVWNFRQVWELKMEGDEYRLNLGVTWRPHTGLVWEAAGEHGPFGTGLDDFSYSLPGVKVGEWQKIEVYLKQHPSDGLFFCRVDGRVVCKHHGPTMVTQYGKKWNLAKVYTIADKITRGPHWQYVDDILLCGDADALRALEGG